ncbi:NAD(P)H-dependent oxidoreductase [Paenibacillus algorifonticola]|uniref:NAD(P)H-dependent oxidoreductase n=1 Tax=Paenibacillus algorifonticola TaxID=684063 RepID=UPI003D2BFF14
MKNILIIQSNPAEGSYGEALAAAYAEGAAGAEVRTIHLSQLDFNPNLVGGYNNKAPLEQDLQEAQAHIKWADHLVFVYPTWWGGPPALLKGFIDRVFLPGFAYKYVKGKALPEQLLKGKTARIIVTMDVPGWYYRFFQGMAGHKMMKINTLQFCGVKSVRFTTLYEVRKSSLAKRQGWLSKVKQLGEKFA